jgi:hypothetical protein
LHHQGTGCALTHITRSLEDGPIVSPLGYLPRAFGPGGNITSTVRDVLVMAHVFLNGGKAPNGGSRESFYKQVFNAILTELGAVTILDLPNPDPALDLDVSRYVGVYGRLGARYEVASEGGKLSLTFALNPMQAQFLGKPERITYELLPISETHFLMPGNDTLEDTQTVAIYDFKNGSA